MPESNHIILRQTLEWETDQSDRSANAIAGELSALCKGRMVAMLEKALERFDKPDRVIRIDRLVVELEYEQDMAIEDWIAQYLPAALEKALQEADMEEHYRVISPGLADLEILTTFLTTGYMPWNAKSGITWQELEYRISEALASHPEWQSKLSELWRNPLYLNRLLQQFSAQMPWRIANIRIPGAEEAYREKWKNVSDAPQHPARENFWKLMFQEGHIPESMTDEGLEKQAFPPQDSVPIPDGTPGTGEGIFIQNAGLVLLHPYISYLLEYTGILEKETITDPEKALFLLHYAVTGQTEAPEWELVLPKILCGVSLTENIRRVYPLDQTDLAQVEELLKSVISHWGALGDISNTGLRESFLQRNGRLTEQETHWTLQVEQQAFDLLLDQLPWGIGTIRLSWMPKPLYTEWV